MQLLRYKLSAGAGDNYPAVLCPANCILKRVEVLVTNPALTATAQLNMVWVKNNYETEQSLHLDSNIPLTDLDVWAWDGEIHFDAPFTVTASLSGSVALDTIELVVCIEPDGERKA